MAYISEVVLFASEDVNVATALEEMVISNTVLA